MHEAINLLAETWGFWAFATKRPLTDSGENFIQTTKELRREGQLIGSRHPRMSRPQTMRAKDRSMDVKPPVGLGRMAAVLQDGIGKPWLGARVAPCHTEPLRGAAPPAARRPQALVLGLAGSSWNPQVGSTDRRRGPTPSDSSPRPQHGESVSLFLSLPGTPQALCCLSVSPSLPPPPLSAWHLLRLLPGDLMR